MIEHEWSIPGYLDAINKGREQEVTTPTNEEIQAAVEKLNTEVEVDPPEEGTTGMPLKWTKSFIREELQKPDLSVERINELFDALAKVEADEKEFVAKAKKARKKRERKAVKVIIRMVAEEVAKEVVEQMVANAIVTLVPKERNLSEESTREIPPVMGGGLPLSSTLTKEKRNE